MRGLAVRAEAAAPTPKPMLASYNAKMGESASPMARRMSVTAPLGLREKRVRFGMTRTQQHPAVPTAMSVIMGAVAFATYKETTRVIVVPRPVMLLVNGVSTKLRPTAMLIRKSFASMKVFAVMVLLLLANAMILSGLVRGVNMLLLTVLRTKKSLHLGTVQSAV